MKLDKKSMLLYVVTDRTWLGEHRLEEQVEEAIKAGATFIQLREKNRDVNEFIDIARKIKKITHRYQVPFVINDNVDVAIAVDADGVHIGQKDENYENAREKLGMNKIIGMSAHNVLEAMNAQRAGANYIGVGAVFNTTTKIDANTLSYDTLKDICKAVDIPVVAIGGISKENILELTGSGIDGVAVISAIFAQEDITMATQELIKIAKNMVYAQVV